VLLTSSEIGKESLSPPVTLVDLTSESGIVFQIRSVIASRLGNITMCSFMRSFANLTPLFLDSPPGGSQARTCPTAICFCRHWWGRAEKGEPIREEEGYLFSSSAYRRRDPPASARILANASPNCLGYLIDLDRSQCPAPPGSKERSRQPTWKPSLR